MEKIEVIERAANRLLQHNVAEARRTIETEYPFHKLTAQGRNYTDKEKMAAKKVIRAWDMPKIRKVEYS